MPDQPATGRCYSSDLGTRKAAVVFIFVTVMFDMLALG
jgi:hypothetical protein